MKVLIATLLFLISLISFGQAHINFDNFPQKVSLNGSQNLTNAFIVFPLTSETIGFDSTDINKFISQNPKRKVFYCYSYTIDNKSRTFDLGRESLPAADSLNFIIPDIDFYENLYRLGVALFATSQTV